MWAVTFIRPERKIKKVSKLDRLTFSPKEQNYVVVPKIVSEIVPKNVPWNCPKFVTKIVQHIYEKLVHKFIHKFSPNYVTDIVPEFLPTFFQPRYMLDMSSSWNFPARAKPRWVTSIFKLKPSWQYGQYVCQKIANFYSYSKVIDTKYSKHRPSTVAHTFECVCSKINHGLNHGLFILLLKLINCPIHWIA